MVTGKSGESGKSSQEILNYYDEKSKGGYIERFILDKKMQLKV